MRRILLFIVIFAALDIYSFTKGYEIGDNKEREPVIEKICIRCHAQISIRKAEIKEQIRKDKRCVECHGSEDADREILPTSDRKIRPVSREGIRHNDDMVLIPAGEFIIGNNGRSRAEGEGDLDERPTHKVYIDAFYIDRYEVTNAEYKRFVDATDHRTPIKWKGGTYPSGKGDHPTVYVSWTDAYSYCRWAGKRLPTEEEWEKAARGTDGRHFPWGNEFDPMKANTPQYWLNIGKEGGTMPVGSFEKGKSPYGLYDMAGNVYEWTESWYKPYPGNRFPNIHYGEKNKVMRGGSWYDCLSYGCGLSSPVYNRTRFAPEIRNNNTGFRCARNP